MRRERGREGVELEGRGRGERRGEGRGGEVSESEKGESFEVTETAQERCRTGTEVREFLSLSYPADILVRPDPGKGLSHWVIG
jgi:hypothetical protein